MINRPEEKLKYGANTVIIPKLSISNVPYSQQGWNDASYWKGHYNSVVQQLRETINSQAEIIAELTLAKSKIVKQLDEVRELLDDLKHSVMHEALAKMDRDEKKTVMPVVAAGNGWATSTTSSSKVPKEVRESYSGTGWNMSSSGDIRIDDDDDA